MTADAIPDTTGRTFTRSSRRSRNCTYLQFRLVAEATLVDCLARARPLGVLPTVGVVGAFQAQSQLPNAHCNEAVPPNPAKSSCRLRGGVVETGRFS